MATNIKEIIAWKINWIKNASEICTAQAESLNRLTASTVPIKSVTKKDGNMWGSCTPEQLLKLIEKNHGIYELLHKFPQKVYFDIDSKEDLPLATVMEQIEELFPNGEFAVSGSITPEKTSYHIISNKYILRDEADRQQMKIIVKYMCENINPAYDWKVYTKNRVMKCINQSKLDGRVQEIITVPDFKRHCITCFFNDFLIPLPTMTASVEKEIQIEKSKRPFDLGTLPKMVLNIDSKLDFDYETLSATEILKLLPLNETFDYSYTHLVARFCYGNGIDFDTYLTWLQNKNKAIVKNAQGMHQWEELGKFPPVNNARIKTILAYYYPQIKKDKSYRDFAQTFNLPTQCIIPIETMTQECFIGPEKYSVCSIGMGGGKTAQTIDYLKMKPSFCWICPNKALAYNTQNRLNVADVNATHYEDISTILKKAGALNEEHKLISVLNSIHYLNHKRFDIIVIDEIETMLDKFMGDFLEQKAQQLKLKVWTEFVYMLRHAKKVIFLDAFITTKTTNFIQMLEGTLDSTKIFTRIFEPCTRTITYMNGVELMISDIIKKVRQGSKVFIFYPYKHGANTHVSMLDFHATIERETGKKGTCYNADIDDSKKQELRDVNLAWADKSFIITNNIITCGVNYERLDFDYKFLFIASFNSPRDIIQVSYRARYLSTGIIKICYMGKMNQTNAWLNDCTRINDPLYTALYKSILVEKKAPIKRSFHLFCTKAHYKQVTDKTVMSEALEKEIQELLTKNDMGFSYDTIQDINPEVVEYIQSLCFSQEATMMQKVELQKHFFKLEFTDDGVDEHDTIAGAWNDRCLFFFSQLKYCLLTPTSVFNKIAVLNKLPTIFPTDIKKTKLNSEILEQIFSEFSFKFITKTSSPHKILMEIYNVYFAKYVVTSMYAGGKGAKKVGEVSYYIGDEWNEYYEFAKQHMILDKESKMTFNNSQTVEESVCEF